MQILKQTKTNNKNELLLLGGSFSNNPILVVGVVHVDEPVEYPATYLIPKIHHAGLPEDIAMRDMDKTETWKYNIRELNNKNVA